MVEFLYFFASFSICFVPKELCKMRPSESNRHMQNLCNLLVIRDINAGKTGIVFQ